MSTNDLKSDLAGLNPMPDDPILGLVELYNKDTRAEKVNLGVGCYLNEAGKLPLEAAVEAAERRLVERAQPRGYSPMSGSPVFCERVRELVFGKNNAAVKAGRIASVQTLGGTGALQLAGAFAHQFLGVTKGVVSDPTWANHISILQADGLEVGKYTYITADRSAVDFEGLKANLKALEPRTLVLMHACCHNPTGLDLTQEQWCEIAQIVREKNLLPLLDMAYQGLGAGLEEDAFALRLFADEGIPFLAATSCSKNFGLYGERVGALHIACADEKNAATVLSILKALVRQEYSNPPCHGAKIVTEVLGDEELTALWKKEVNGMRNRILAMRTALYEAGRAEGQDFSFAVTQHGMFSFTGLSAEEMDVLREEFAVYGVRNGRICIAGLNMRNVGYVAKALATVFARRK